MAPTTLSAQSTVGEWLEHPVGGPNLRALLAQGGTDESSLAPVRGLPLAKLVEMSKGAMPMEVVDHLIAQVEAGIVPEDAPPAPEKPAEPAPVPFVFKEYLSQGRFEGKTIIVTGAASGIGRATASRVAREGGRVIATDITEAGLETLKAELEGHAVETVAGDVSDDDSIARILEAAGPAIHGLANVAGIMDKMQPVHEVEQDLWDRVFRINVTGPMKLMKAVIPAMLEAGYGSIVNVGSEASLRGSAAGTAYTASKHAVAGLTKSTAFLYGDSGIRVNMVAPGPTATGIESSFASELAARRIRRAMAVLPAIGSAESVASSIVYLLSDDASNVSGALLPSDGGWSAV